MRTLVPEPKSTRHTTPAKPTALDRAAGHSLGLNSIIHRQPMIGNPVVQRRSRASSEGLDDATAAALDRFGHDFSGIPVHASAPGVAGKGDDALLRSRSGRSTEAWLSPTATIQRKCSSCAAEEDEVQAKLPVSQPNDPLEQEADRFAEQVMNARTPTAPRSAAPAVQRDMLDDAVRQVEQSDEEKEEQPRATRPATAMAKRRGAEPQTLAVNAIPRSGGRSLEPDVRHFFSERTGLDFAHVRIHADGAAAASASRLSARAYTVGSNIYFGRGEYAPKTREGRTLLAHELAHVVQQGGGRVQRQTKGLPPNLSSAPSSALIQPKLQPPGNCIQGIHDAMQRAVKQVCDHPSGRACTPGEPCRRLLQKIRRNQMCARNRRAINRICYEGGDVGHRIAERDARFAQGTCMAILRDQCLPKPVPKPEKQPERAPERAPEVDRGFMERMAAITGLTGTALIVYLIISEGSRVFPPRNLIPVP